MLINNYKDNTLFCKNLIKLQLFYNYFLLLSYYLFTKYIVPVKFVAVVFDANQNGNKQ